MRRSILILSAGLLAACQSSVPNSAAQGVGFGNYGDYQAQRARREAELTGSPVPTGLPISNETTGAAAPVVTGAPVTTAAAAQAQPAPDLNNPGISNEQNFEVVSNRESIESDAERLERQREARVEIGVEELPSRPGGSGPSIAEYALATSNAVGQKVYRRGPTSNARHERACGRFASDDLAQEAFLKEGGPDRDPKGLDPDGDGFACDWDPAPFRAARRG